MILGIGVDLVDLGRFDRAVTRTPRLVERLFAVGERGLPLHSLAARFAAKEALIKAVGDSAGMHWTEMEVITDGEGRPAFDLRGRTAEVVAGRGARAVHLSLTHDGGLACAFVVLESGER